MRSSTLPLLFLVACASADGAGEHSARTRSAFASAHAKLLDFEFDGHLIADTTDAGTLRTLVEAQLLFTVGQLNGERAVGQLGRLELSDITATLVPSPPAATRDAGTDDAGVPAPAAPAPPPSYRVSYHARLPVAWSQPTIPSSYTFTLPQDLSESAQDTFATKYGSTCRDPEAPADAGHMFIGYRPEQAGCTLAEGDIATFDASVTTSSENTRGKYPEYHQLWADGVLRVVAMFSRELPTGAPNDAGMGAYDQFLWNSYVYLRGLQPDFAKLTPPPPYSSSGVTTTKVAAELPDGRTVRIDVALVDQLMSGTGPSFDDWYESLTPTADVVLYNGHAGLGANVRTLMSKGTFRPKQYLIWFANGCDTFAYVDRTLVDRRALVNPDDPGGTKYMDTVTNVMAGYFGTLQGTSMTFLQALVEGRDYTREPKTYEQIFGKVDPEQTVVVTGEEDNVLGFVPPPPPMAGPNPELEMPPVHVDPPPDPEPPVSESAEPPAAPAQRGGNNGCSTTGTAHDRGAAIAMFGTALATLLRRRRRFTNP